jgi:hypothetical protein
MGDQTAGSRPPSEAPWIAGLRAARANIVPGLVVQGVMLALLLAYHFHPQTTGLLNRLATVKEQWGYGYSAVSAIIAGALVPELLRVLFFQKGKFHHQNAANLLFTVPFWCMMGTVVDGFYRAQAVWFGNDQAFPVVLKKVIVDQLANKPLFAAPVTAILYDWKNRGYSLTGFTHCLTPTYYRNVVVPTIFANWGVWIPVVSILYSLPLPLQIPLFGLALSMWVMLFTWMRERRASERKAGYHC